MHHPTDSRGALAGTRNITKRYVTNLFVSVLEKLSQDLVLVVLRAS